MKTTAHGCRGRKLARILLSETGAMAVRVGFASGLRGPEMTEVEDND